MRPTPEVQNGPLIRVLVLGGIVAGPLLLADPSGVRSVPELLLYVPARVTSKVSGRGGVVTLEIRVSETGVPTVLRSVAGEASLVDAARAAVAHWIYLPLIKDGRPVPAQFRIQLDVIPGLLDDELKILHVVLHKERCPKACFQFLCGHLELPLRTATLTALRARAASDPDPSVRETAAWLLEAYGYQ
jgi:hypothetical protein